MRAENAADGAAVNLRGVRRNRYLERIEIGKRITLAKQRQTSLCIEFSWLFGVISLYIFILVDTGGLDWRY